MMSERGEWSAEQVPAGWEPTWWGDSLRLSLPIWFRTERECREWIAERIIGSTLGEPA